MSACENFWCWFLPFVSQECFKPQEILVLKTPNTSWFRDHVFVNIQNFNIAPKKSDIMLQAQTKQFKTLIWAVTKTVRWLIFLSPLSSLKPPSSAITTSQRSHPTDFPSLVKFHNQQLTWSGDLIHFPLQHLFTWGYPQGNMWNGGHDAMACHTFVQPLSPRGACCTKPTWQIEFSYVASFEMACNCRPNTVAGAIDSKFHLLRQRVQSASRSSNVRLLAC